MGSMERSCAWRKGAPTRCADLRCQSRVTVMEIVMTEPAYDLIIRGGRVATTTDTFEADVAIASETIAAIGRGLGPAKREIDARGKFVLPGGVDSHCHIEQLSAAGIVNADTFESATTSAAFGGTTSVISFAAQHVGMQLPQVLEDYHALARKGAVIDYAFHMIIADPTRATLERDLPALIQKGHGSIKVFMTYDLLKIDDEPLLDIMVAAREGGAMLCVHAENHGIISWMVKRLLARGYTQPKYHAISHARFSEAEAFNRLIGMAALVDQPIMIFHVSAAGGHQSDPRCARPGVEGLRRDMPAISLPYGRRPRQAGHGGREVDVQPAAAG